MALDYLSQGTRKVKWLDLYWFLIDELELPGEDALKLIKDMEEW